MPLAYADHQADVRRTEGDTCSFKVSKYNPGMVADVSSRNIGCADSSKRAMEARKVVQDLQVLTRCDRQLNPEHFPNVDAPNLQYET